MKLRRLNERRALRSAFILVVAVVAAIITFTVVWLIAAKDSYLYAFFFERSWIQHTTITVFWMTMASLALMQIDHRNERRAHVRAAQILAGPELQSILIWSHAPQVREMFRQTQDTAFYGSITFRRIVRALERLHATQSTTAMESYFRASSEADAAELDTNYSGIRYGVWLLPTLGFLGTVMGIGVGIAGFSGVIQNAKEFSGIKQGLPMITQQLGTAFDTTLLALVVSAVAVCYMSLLLKQQERLLEDTDRLCSDGLGSVFQEHSTATESVIHAIHENVEEIGRRMNGNRGAIEQLIRREMPTIVADGVAASLRSVEDSVTTVLHALGERLSDITAARAATPDALSTDLRQLTATLNRVSTDIQAALAEIRIVQKQERRE